MPRCILVGHCINRVLYIIGKIYCLCTKPKLFLYCFKRYLIWKLIKAAFKTVWKTWILYIVVIFKGSTVPLKIALPFLIYHFLTWYTFKFNYFLHNKKVLWKLIIKYGHHLSIQILLSVLFHGWEKLQKSGWDWIKYLVR